MVAIIRAGPRIGRVGAAAAMVVVVAFVAALVLALLASPGVDASGDDPPPSEPVSGGGAELVLFWGDGCPHCEAEREFLVGLRAEHPDLVVREYEVWYDADNQRRFVETLAALGMEAGAVPTTVIGDRVWIGYSAATGDEIRAVVEAALAGEEVDETTSHLVDVPFVGAVDLGGRSLLASTIVIGFVDGVNPCSLWVLSILLALVLHSGSRRRVALVGSVFLGVTAAMYGLYIVGAYGVLSYVGWMPWIELAVAAVAITLGVFQLRDAARVGTGSTPTLGLSPRSKARVARRARWLGATDRPLPALLGATVAMAVGVSLLETPCTLGLPLLWSDLIAESGIAAVGAAVLFLVYLAAFLIDELVLFGAVLVTMRAVKVQERHGRALKVVSGTVMVTLGASMVVRPELLDTIAGTVAVFLAAAVLSAIVLAVIAASAAPSQGAPPGAAHHRHT